MAGLFWAGASAEESENYIVYLKPTLKLQSASKTQRQDYCVVNKEKLDRLISENKVSYYEPDLEIKLFDDFEGGEATGKWNLDCINISKAWNIGCFGNDIRVGVIDTGATHSDLEQNLLIKEGEKYLAHNYINGSTDTTDNVGHGTYVSGIIAAEANNEYITGIANRAKIIPLKCFDKNASTKVSMIADAIYDAVDVCKCDVINLSFGMAESSTSKTLRLSVEHAINNGCIVVASAGNDGDSKIYYPAKYDGVIGVGSIDEQKQLSYFSQRNETVDFVAPGSRIESLVTAKFKDTSGTSFSAPHISALAAIAKCIDKDITPKGFEDILKETATDLGDEGYDTSFGYGLVNAEAMVDKMLENTEYFISPIAVNKDNTQVRIYNNSKTDLSAVGIVAEYEDDIFRFLNLEAINLPSNGAITLSGSNKGMVRFMLWQSLKSANPLSDYREFLNSAEKSAE